MFPPNENTISQNLERDPLRNIYLCWEFYPPLEFYVFWGILDDFNWTIFLVNQPRFPIFFDKLLTPSRNF